MTFKHTNSAIFITAILFSVVKNQKVPELEPTLRAELSEIKTNISRVNNLLVDALKKYVELERTAELDKNENSSRRDHLIKNKTDKDTDERKRLEDKLATLSHELFGEPLSDQSGKEAESETEERESQVKRENNDKNISTHSATAKNSSKTLSNSDLEEETTMLKEVLKAKALRQAYEDACLKVVLRKCNKALEDVSKDACRAGRKCTGKFKDDFKNNAITSCNREFSKQSVACRAGHGSDIGVIDQLKTDSHNLRRNNIDTQAENINILRNEYEKACQQSNYDKCRAACKYTVDKTCKTNDCVQEKEKALNKSCERHCKNNYRLRAGSDSDDDSDSDDSDSDSDSDSL